MIGLTYSVDTYNEFKETNDKDVFEKVVDYLILDKSDDIELKDYIKSLPKKNKRIAILSTMGDNILWSKINILLQEKKSSYQRLKEVYFLLKDYVKIADVERKQHGEILTPFKELAEPMIKLVDKYDTEFWKNKNHKVLDSSAGYGTFLILAAYKFMVGLKDEFPDEEERFKWIVENCLYYGELQARSVFSWLVAIDPYDEYKTNTYWGSFLTDEFDKHAKEVWGVEKFDLIIQNPPYQEVVGPRKTQQIWGKFVNKSYNLLVDDGYMNFVHPGGWRFITNRSMSDLKFVNSIYKNNKIIYAEFHTYKDGKDIFGVETDYDIIFLKKQKNDGKSLVKTNKDGIIEVNMKSFGNNIPTDNIKLFNKLTTGDEKVNLIFEFYYDHRKKILSTIKDDYFKYPVIYGLPLKGMKLLFSNENKVHFGISKLILVRASTKTILDTNGDYGMTEYAGGIVDTPDNLLKIKEVVDSEEFKKLKAYFLGVVSQNTNAAIDAPGNMFKIIREFKKDFWKEFI
jgi:hypothetical protein